MRCFIYTTAVFDHQGLGRLVHYPVSCSNFIGDFPVTDQVKEKSNTVFHRFLISLSLQAVQRGGTNRATEGVFKDEYRMFF